MILYVKLLSIELTLSNTLNMILHSSRNFSSNESKLCTSTIYFSSSNKCSNPQMISLYFKFNIRLSKSNKFFSFISIIFIFLIIKVNCHNTFFIFIIITHLRFLVHTAYIYVIFFDYALHFSQINIFILLIFYAP